MRLSVTLDGQLLVHSRPEADHAWEFFRIGIQFTDRLLQDGRPQPFAAGDGLQGDQVGIAGPDADDRDLLLQLEIDHLDAADGHHVPVVDQFIGNDDPELAAPLPFELFSVDTAGQDDAPALVGKLQLAEGKERPVTVRRRDQQRSGQLAAGTGLLQQLYQGARRRSCENRGIPCERRPIKPAGWRCHDEKEMFPAVMPLRPWNRRIGTSLVHPVRQPELPDTSLDACKHSLYSKSNNGAQVNFFFQLQAHMHRMVFSPGPGLEFFLTGPPFFGSIRKKTGATQAVIF